MAAVGGPIDGGGVVIHAYHSAAQPKDWLTDLPVKALDSRSAKTDAVTSLDLSEHIGVPSPATSPGLTASFVRCSAGSTVRTDASASSQAFFAVRGAGTSSFSWPEGMAGPDGPVKPRTVEWSAGDLFVVPASAAALHAASTAAGVPAVPGLERPEDDAGDDAAVLYWVHDAPMLSYLGAAPTACRFDPAKYDWGRMLAEVERIRHEPGAEHRNRLGILLSSSAPWAARTRTLTPTLWALLNVIPAGDVQPPHRHNSVALDLAVSAPAGGGVYTMMSPELGPDGRLVDPVRVEWVAGAAFVTPPGWWHSHHNETGEDAWVLPVQDAGLHTHMQTLNIRFAPRPAPSE